MGENERGFDDVADLAGLKVMWWRVRQQPLRRPRATGAGAIFRPCTIPRLRGAAIVGSLVRSGGVVPLAEVAKFLLDASGIGVAALFPVELQRFPPHRTSMIVLANGHVRLAQPVKCVGQMGDVAEVAGQDSDLLEVADSLVVVAGLKGNVAQAVQGCRVASVAGARAQGQRRQAVAMGQFILAKSSLCIGHLIERASFSFGTVKCPVEGQRARRVSTL